MSRTEHARRAAIFLCAWAVAMVCGPAAAADDSRSSDDAVVLYRIRPGDTLIGIGQRLLTHSDLWRRLGALNRVAHDRRLRPGSVLQIPLDWLRWTPQLTSVRALNGAVSAQGRPLAAGDALAEGAQIVSAADGSAALLLADGSQLTLAPDSSLTLLHARSAGGTDAPDVQLQLSRGHVEVGARKHTDTGRFEIRTPVAATAVRGTRFRGHFNPSDASATTETLEGIVTVGTPTAALPVGAGFGTRADEGKAPLPPVRLLPPPVLAGLADLSTSPSMELDFPRLPQAHAYRVQLAHDPQFSALERDVRFDAPPARLGELADGVHWLRVRAIDAFGIEGMDAVREVRQHTLPAPPQPAEPQAMQDAGGSAAHFSWSDTGTRYRFELADDATFARAIATRNALEAPQLTLPAPAVGHYVWRVAAVTAAGEAGPWSAVQQFIQRPAAVAADVTVEPRSRLIEARCPQQDGYECDLQISRNRDFADPLLERRIGTATTGLSRIPPGWYFARTRWVDADGYVGPAGPSRRLFVPPPRWLWLIIPVVASAALL